MVKTPIRIINVEDNEDDSELVRAHLQLRDFDVTFLRVETGPELSSALCDSHWDIVLADYSLPKFDAGRALEVIKTSGIDLPLIVVSGTIGEARAIEMMRAGANDFVLKGDFARLLPAVKRELKEAANRKARKVAEVALHQSEENFRQLADSMTHLAWIARPDGHIFWYNKRWYEYTGTALPEMQGWGWQKVHHPEHANRVLEFVKDAWLKPEPFELTFPLRSASGAYRWFLTRVVPLVTDAGEISQWFGTNTDIHEVKSYEHELRIAKDQAEAASEAKSRFLANMSHEIRTPIGAMLGFLDLVKEPSTSPAELSEYVSAVDRNGQQLLRLIDDILDLSKIEAGKLDVHNARLSLRHLLSEINSVMGFRAREKGLYFNLKLVAEIPEFIESDIVRIRQILSNIIGNAIKFTEQGGVELCVDFDFRGLSITVNDTGIGLTQNQITKLFEPFMQADPAINRKFGGSGLGLALSRRLAQALGGTLDITQSELKSGSSFKLFLPVAAMSDTKFFVSESLAASTESSQPAAYATQARLRGMRILLVEDSPDNQFLVSRILSGEGAKVEIAENGNDGIAKAIGSTFDVVIMDMQMPLCGGLEATKRLRDKGYDRPIVALTAHAMEDERRKAFAVGCTDYLTKPIDKPRLISVLTRYSHL